MTVSPAVVTAAGVSLIPGRPGRSRTFTAGFGGPRGPGPRPAAVYRFTPGKGQSGGGGWSRTSWVRSMSPVHDRCASPLQVVRLVGIEPRGSPADCRGSEVARTKPAQGRATAGVNEARQQRQIQLRATPQDGAPGWSRTNTPPLKRRLLCQSSYRRMEPSAGFEPASRAYGARALPLDDDGWRPHGESNSDLPIDSRVSWPLDHGAMLVETGGFEPPSRAYQAHALPLSYASAVVGSGGFKPPLQLS